MGTNKLDESICTIFDELRQKGEKARLVHVPEFVMTNIRYPDLFKFKSERGFDEYIVPISRLYPLKNAPPHRRWPTRRFLSEYGDDRILVTPIDLTQETNKKLLHDSAESWWRKGSVNDLLKLEVDALQTSIAQSEEIDIENICIFIDGQLQGFCLYQLPSDGQYAIVNHVKLNTTIPRLFDFMAYAIGKWLGDRGIVYVNLEYDLGLPRLRMIKLALGPINSFRKYTIEPIF